MLGVVVLMYAGIQPPFDILINYAVGLIVLLVVLRFGVERRPVPGAADRPGHRPASGEIVEAERAVGQTA